MMLGLATNVYSQTQPVPTANVQLQVVRGLASELAISVDGTVYTLDGSGAPWVQRIGSGGVWSRLPGQFRALRAGLDGSMRAISLNDQVYLLSGSWWREVGSDFGLARDVAVSPDGSVYTLQIDGTLVATTPIGQSLGRLDATDSGGYERLMVDEHGLPWLWRGNGMLLRYDGLKWVASDRFASVGIRRIASGIDGTILLVDGGGYVYRWNSVSADWTLEALPGPAFTVAIGPGGKPWYLSNVGEIWASEIFSTVAAPAAKKPPALFTRLLKWNRVSGQAQALSVGADSTVLTIDEQKNVWKWKGRNDWTPLPGKFKRIAAGTAGSAWGIDDEDRVRRYVSGQWIDTALLGREIAIGPKGEAFAVAMDGQLAQFDDKAKLWRSAPTANIQPRFVAVGKDGEPWIIDNEGTVVRHVGERWQAFAGIAAASIAIGPEGTVYATTGAMELFWLDLRSREWKPAVGVASSVSVGPAGTPWIIGERSQLFVSASFVAQREATTPSVNKIPMASPTALITVAPPAASVLASLLKPLTYTLIPGTYVDVGIGAEGSVYAAGADGGLYCFDNTSKRFKFAAQGTIRKVIATGNGMPWVVNAAGQVAFFDRGEWTTVADFKATDIAIGSDAMVYATQADNYAVYRYSNASTRFEPVTTYSTGVALRAKKIAFASNVLWAVTPSNQLLKCTDTQCQLQTVSPTDVASGPEGSVMVTDALGGVQRWNARGGGFIGVKGNGIALSVGPQGLPWLVAADGQILSSGLFALNSKSINTATCAQKFQGKPVPLVTTTALQISATADVFALSPGGSASLLDNDRLSGAVPTSSNVTVTLTSPSPLLTVAGGRVTLSPTAVRGSTLSASYSICAVADPSRCSVASITVTVVSTVVAVADAATLSPGGTLNLLANDSLNGAVPTFNDVSVKLITNSAYLSQAAGAITLALNAPPGSTHTATYAICQSPANTPCSAIASVTIAVPGSITALADVATLNPGASLNLLANDALNGAVPTSGQVSAAFTTRSAFLSQSGGVLTLAPNAPTGSTQSGTYTLCQAPANTLCSGPVNVIITVPSAITAVADAATLNPGATLNLLTNDRLNGATPLAAQVGISFSTTSAFLSQAGGVVTLAANAPLGSTQTASYSICQTPANTLCSGPVSVTITIPGAITALPDAATLNPGGAVNLLTNDLLNGTAPSPTQVSISFNTSSVYLSQTGSVVTLAANAPLGSTQTASYSICQTPANTLCSGPVGVTITVPGAITALPDAATLNPGSTVNLLTNDRLNGATPSPAQVSISFNTTSAYLTQMDGVVTLAANAPLGSTQTASYSICQTPANTLCSGPVSVTITTPGAITAVADAATLNPGGTVNLLTNDLLNGAMPSPAQVSISFNTTSAYLTQVNGVVTLAANAPLGSTQSASYSICQTPANTLCSGPVAVTITVPGSINAVADTATLNPGGTLDVLANDSLNGAVPRANQLTITFNTTSAYLSQINGVLSLASNAPSGSPQTATYSICQSPANVLCSGPVSVTITVPGVIAAVADTATLTPSETINLLANDSLNGTVALASRVTVSFNTASAFLTQSDGVLTLASNAPTGSTLTASYSICERPGNVLCSGIAGVTISVPSVISATDDVAILSPGASLNLLANDRLNGVAPTASTVAIFFSSTSAYLSQNAGILTVADNAPAGTTQTAAYRICQSPNSTLCSAVVGVSITIPGAVAAITAVADAALLTPGGTLNLLANDTLNGAVPLAAQVTVTFSTTSTFLSQTGGVITLAAGAPTGSTQTATYSICQRPANTLCSGTVSVTISVLSVITAVADAATLSPGGTLNLLANDSLNGAPPLPAQVNVTFNPASAFLTQTGGVLTLAAGAPTGSTQSATYRICQSPANTPCSGPVNVTITVPSAITAVADVATVSPGGTLNLLANDSLNGATPLSSQVTVTFNTASAFLSQTGGVVTVAAGALTGSTHTATYSICQSPANTLCSGPVNVTITVPSVITAFADAASLAPGGTLNLLFNDRLNGDAPLPAQVVVTFNTASAFLSQVGGLLTLAPGAPTGSTQTATYSICQSPANTPCSGPVNVTITVPSAIAAVADAATLSQGGTLNLLTNDSLNGIPPLSSQVAVTFNTASAFLSQTGGVLALAAGTPTGTMQTATYSICQSPANTPCSGPVSVTITVPSSITAVADTASVSPSGTLNLLANDVLNGAPPVPSQVAVSFSTSSAFLVQAGGVVTVDANTPPGSTQTATYSICQAPANTPCSQTVNVTISVPSAITALADAATLSPGGTLNLLANDLLNGSAPLSSQVAVTFNTASPTYLSQTGGVLTLSASAVGGNTLSANYSICQLPANTPCSGPVNVSITVQSTISAVADAVTVNPGGTFNLFANDLLNGASPLPGQVAVTFNTASAFLTQANGVVTLAAGAPAGAVQTATYRICVPPANTTCSATVAVNVTAPVTAIANPDGPRILTRGIGAGIGLHLNDTLNGVLVPPGAMNVQYTLNDNIATFKLSTNGYLQLLDDMFATPGIYTLSYTFCEAGVPTNCSSTTATINVQAP